MTDLVFNKVWSPIPDSSQELAMDARANEIMYCGTRGPGKTDLQIMKFRSRVGMGYGHFWKGIILDRRYKNLDDIKSKGQKWFPQFEDGVKFKRSAGSLMWTWPTGEELLLRAAETLDDYWNFHGHEYPFIGWNELTKYPTSELYDMFKSINRTSFRPEDHPKTIDKKMWEDHGMTVFVKESHPNAVEILLPEIPLEIVSTTNPFGPGHYWVKQKFIDVAEYGEVVKTTTTVYNPRTKLEEDVVSTQVAIFGSWKENPYLPLQYIASLLNDDDETRKKAWADGSWDIVAGGALSDVWDKNVHVVPRFAIPETWYVDRCFDWGSTHPFYVGWFAQSNGEEAYIVHGEKVYTFCPPPGTLVCLYEYYGTKKIGTNKGIKATAVEIADDINEIENNLLINGWVVNKPMPGPADNQISNVSERDVLTIEKKMADKGVHWTKSDKSPGSRINGLQLMRDMLVASKKKEGPGLYFMNNCKAAIITLPILPRDEKKMDDVDTCSEDHPYDAIRYKVLEAGLSRPVSNLLVEYPS